MLIELKETKERTPTKYGNDQVVDKPNFHDDFKQAQIAGGWIPGMDPKVDILRT
jgi:hypothetical protein